MRRNGRPAGYRCRLGINKYGGSLHLETKITQRLAATEKKMDALTAVKARYSQTKRYGKLMHQTSKV